MPQHQLHMEYDPETDLLLARLGAPAEADTVEIDGDVAVRVSRETGQPISIEVVDCAARSGRRSPRRSRASCWRTTGMKPA